MCSYISISDELFSQFISIEYLPWIDCSVYIALFCCHYIPSSWGHNRFYWHNDPYKLALHWRHNGRDSISNHQPRDCLLNRLFRCRSKKTSKLRVTGLCVGNSPGPVNSPHKWPVTRKFFPFDDVIMGLLHWHRGNHSLCEAVAECVGKLDRYQTKYNTVECKTCVSFSGNITWNSSM